MSKQVLAVVIVFAIGVCGVRAQTPQQKFPRWSLGLTAGPAFPVGKFASKALNSNESGHAHTGPGAELTVTRWLTRSIGLVVTAALEKYPIGTYTTPFNPASGGLTINYDPWTIIRFGLGLSFTHPLSRRLSFDIRATAGLLKTRAPGYMYYSIPVYNLYIFTTSQPLQIVYTSRPLPWSFVYETGADLKWQLKGKLFLLANASYAASSCNFHNSSIDQFFGQANYQTNIVQRHRPIAGIRAGLGVGLSF